MVCNGSGKYCFIGDNTKISRITWVAVLLQTVYLMVDSSYRVHFTSTRFFSASAEHISLHYHCMLPGQQMYMMMIDHRGKYDLAINTPSTQPCTVIWVFLFKRLFCRLYVSELV